MKKIPSYYTRIILPMLVVLTLFIVYNFRTISKEETSLRKIISHEYFSSEKHPGYPLQESLENRLYRTPSFVVNQLSDWDELHYRAEDWTATRKAQMLFALGQLPPKIYQLLSQKIHGFYLIDSSFKGMGFCESTFNNNLELSNFILLNIKIFDKGIDQFLTDKVATNFAVNDDHHVRIRTGTQLSALYAILLHESMHVVDYTHVISPHVDDAHQLWVTSQNKKPALGKWWDLYKTSPPLSFKSRITFYGLSHGPQMKSSELPHIYKELSTHPYPSLYGAKTYVEDWAELGLVYEISKMRGSDLRVDILDGPTVEFTWKPLDHPQIAERFTEVSEWLER
jgi:hypothetical protein